MNADLKLVEGIITDYYNSVEDLFFYRLRNEWKMVFVGILLFFSSFFLAVNIIPILPFSYEGNYMGSLFEFLKVKLNLSYTSNNFWTKWAIGLLLSTLIFIALYSIFKYLSVKNKNNALDRQLLHFCYVYAFRQELKKHIVNGRQEHLNNCIKYSEKINNRLKFVTPVRPSKGNPTINLTTIIDDIRSRYKWFELTDVAQENIIAINNFQEKIAEIIKRKNDLQTLFKPIDYLILYEYALVKPETVNSSNQKLGELTDNYFNSFARELNLLASARKISSAVEPKHKFSYYFRISLNAFVTQNILILFVSWFLFLSVLVAMFALMAIRIFNMIFDSTILIGLLTTPFLGAITLTATIYSKKN